MASHELTSLRYGSETLPIDLPGASVLCAPELEVPADPVAVIRAALANPIGSPPLRELVQPGEKVVIVTSDITRYTGSEIYLPVLVEELNACGIPDGDIEILIALGIHRKQTPEEHAKIVGSLAGRIRVVDHECDDPAELTDLGQTSSGLPVLMNRRLTEADRVIVTGTVGLHYFAGFGGGRKGLVPGVASRTTCMATHYMVFNPPEVGGKHPQATVGVLEGNPVHAAILEAVKKVEPDFLLNTVLSPRKEILSAFAGELEAAHRAACEESRRCHTVAIPNRYDLVVVSCGGAPKDINFIQAHKAFDYGSRALRPGGTMILLAACPDGYGNPTFFDWFRFTDLDAFERELRANYEINGQTAHAALSKAKAFRVLMVTELPAAEVAQMGMEKADSLDEAIALAMAGLSTDNPRMLIIPDGGTLLPVVPEAKSAEH